LLAGQWQQPDTTSTTACKPNPSQDGRPLLDTPVGGASHAAGSHDLDAVGSLAQLVPGRPPNLRSVDSSLLDWTSQVGCVRKCSSHKEQLEGRCVYTVMQQLAACQLPLLHFYPILTSGTPSHTRPMPLRAAPQAQKSSPLRSEHCRQEEFKGREKPRMASLCAWHGAKAHAASESLQPKSNAVGTHLPCMSPCPPVWLSACPVNSRRGPGIVPSSTACARPQSAPPASRTVVKPRLWVCKACCWQHVLGALLSQTRRQTWPSAASCTERKSGGLGKRGRLGVRGYQ